MSIPIEDKIIQVNRNKKKTIMSIYDKGKARETANTKQNFLIQKSKIK